MRTGILFCPHVWEHSNKTHIKEYGNVKIASIGKHTSWGHYHKTEEEK